MKKQFPDVAARHGAPMGRRHFVDNSEAEVTLFEVLMVDGDYDDGGAYWGGPPSEPLFCARDDAGEVETFVRAANWRAAKAELLDAYPDLKVKDAFDYDAMVAAYLKAALWASIYSEDGEHCKPIDDEYCVDDVTEESQARAETDCRNFIGLCEGRGVSLTLMEAGQWGHDFWLTRHHHGVGFWDRNLGPTGDVLTEIAESFPELNPDVIDGKVHIE